VIVHTSSPLRRRARQIASFFSSSLLLPNSNVEVRVVILTIRSAPFFFLLLSEPA